MLLQVAQQIVFSLSLEGLPHKEGHLCLPFLDGRDKIINAFSDVGGGVHGEINMFSIFIGVLGLSPLGLIACHLWFVASRLCCITVLVQRLTRSMKSVIPLEEAGFLGYLPLLTTRLVCWILILRLLNKKMILTPLATRHLPHWSLTTLDVYFLSQNARSANKHHQLGLRLPPELVKVRTSINQILWFGVHSVRVEDVHGLSPCQFISHDCWSVLYLVHFLKHQ